MKKINEAQVGPDRRGRYPTTDELDGVEYTHVYDPNLRNDGRPFRIGDLDSQETKNEGQDANEITDQTDEKKKQSVIEDFSNKIKNAISSKLMGRKVNLKIKGSQDLVDQVTKMIKFETDYLNAIISGQSADTPSLQKNKAIIEMEAKKLDRMLGVSDFWPFK